MYCASAGEAPGHADTSRPKAQVRTCTVNGWTIETRKGTISDESALNGIGHLLGDPPNLPEMIFGLNTLRLKHDATGLAVRYYHL